MHFKQCIALLSPPILLQLPTSTPQWRIEKLRIAPGTPVCKRQCFLHSMTKKTKKSTNKKPSYQPLRTISWTYLQINIVINTSCIPSLKRFLLSSSLKSPNMASLN
ncbi:hypothetical protein I7I53_08179 [Histoplasma capsulatum var. duboisii H88]|uniref:Uncharacterized protein n=1 Tax=Ajellomyces capsulatus (strain H88) TaxID=544711 RepID=A0A8A1LF55_AJEC8|nr:hypothetical protein I7I53_08179 [Histoplasma capsulatum var. duboisii H88]